VSKYVYVLGLALALMGLQPAWAAQDPQALVKQTSDEVLAAVKDRKAELDAAPEKIYGLVEHIVLPHFDFKRMSQLVLGKNWRKASDGQKDAFMEQFREMLVRTYGVALLNYSGQEIKYLPMQDIGDATEANVNTEVRDNGAPPIPINYRLYLKEGEWKVFDIVIDGISLVSNYRTSFNTEIRRNGLDNLVARLKERNQRGKDE
jgi:phospholipid transport system substrate-binding protein